MNKQNQHDFMSGQHSANDPLRPDLREYYADTITMKHPSNTSRSKDNEAIRSAANRQE